MTSLQHCVSADHANTENHNAHARTAITECSPFEVCFTRYVWHEYLDEGVSTTGCFSEILAQPPDMCTAKLLTEIAPYSFALTAEVTLVIGVSYAYQGIVCLTPRTTYVNSLGRNVFGGIQFAHNRHRTSQKWCTVSLTHSLTCYTCRVEVCIKSCIHDLGTGFK